MGGRQGKAWLQQQYFWKPVIWGIHRKIGWCRHYTHIIWRRMTATVIYCFLQKAWHSCLLVVIHKNNEPPISINLCKYLYVSTTKQTPTSGIEFFFFFKELDGKYSRFASHMVSISTTQFLILWCESSHRQHGNMSTKEHGCVPVWLYLQTGLDFGLQAVICQLLI